MPRKKSDAPRLSGGSATIKKNGEKPMLLRLSAAQHTAIMQAASHAEGGPKPASVWVRELAVAAAEKILKKVGKTP